MGGYGLPTVDRLFWFKRLRAVGVGFGVAERAFCMYGSGKVFGFRVQAEFWGREVEIMRVCRFPTCCRDDEPSG